jgi:hypothetical protein
VELIAMMVSSTVRVRSALGGFLIENGEWLSINAELELIAVLAGGA